MKGQGVLISALAFALLIAIFAVINVDSVQVNFMFTTATLPLILVILASTLLGGLTVGLLGMIRQIRLQRTVKVLERQVAELTAEAELAESLTGPLSEEPTEKFGTATSD
ncbi:lipopolysaccharide assembly protein LapA domain-containing protein [Paenibacillus alkaliterrae]|uniref:LapA family protein n=1 Tax=Paenibacillus alkaliterrae TaxID=320909 RepID=UPI001F1628E1|nr:lipopolysaccharide assembly protein LapA domain-containing protein [Paenibacillus alkaliterrae]MCF2939225.1 lipopolysaccharide assembly protein LapA domain-containing protein [Paenibacillus alkaliterrae]